MQTPKCPLGDAGSKLPLALSCTGDTISIMKIKVTVDSKGEVRIAESPEKLNPPKGFVRKGPGAIEPVNRIVGTLEFNVDDEEFTVQRLDDLVTHLRSRLPEK